MMFHNPALQNSAAAATADLFPLKAGSIRGSGGGGSAHNFTERLSNFEQRCMLKCNVARHLGPKSRFHRECSHAAHSACLRMQRMHFSCCAFVV